MRIWLIKEGEPLPIEENARLMRVGLLANYLAEQGHQVVWWSSTFIHGKKEYIADKFQTHKISKNEELVLLHSKVGYKKNISLKRFIYHEWLARGFRKKSKLYPEPDIIFCSYPTAPFAREAERYGKQHNIPVIVDARDEWPDIFLRAFPTWMEPIAKVGLFFLDRQAKRVFRDADAITGVQPSVLNWALNKASREKTSFDRVVFLGHKENTSYSDEELQMAKDEWQRKFDVTENTWNICFFSVLGKRVVDCETIMHAVRRLSEKHPDLRLVFCGDGDAFEYCKEIAKGCDAIVLPGWCNDLQLKSMLSMGKVGLYPLHNLPDFKDALGNKIAGYLAAELPILSELQGFSKTYIDEYKVGITYNEGDVESCMSAIEYLFIHPEKLEEWKKNARNRFLVDFDSEVVNEKLLQLFKDILD